MNCYLIKAKTIKAYWAHGLLFLRADGDSECPKYASISPTPLTIEPPEYQLTTCVCPEPEVAPFDVHAWFELVDKPEEITVHTADGPQKVPVESFPANLIADFTTPSFLSTAPVAGEVIGISPNSWDVNRAITDAVNKLQKIYPGRVNATVVETGVVAAGSPVGIAFLYVRMREAAGIKPTPPPEPPPAPPKNKDKEKEKDKGGKH